MAYVIFIADGEESDRRELRGAATIGRAPDCDICVHDILLSRHHCRLEQAARGWVVFDLHSKNGTHLGGNPVCRHVLKDGDELRIGRTWLIFRAGAFVAVPKQSWRRVVERALDPHEALAGTVSGMYVCDAEDMAKYDGLPFPQPRPANPASYQDASVYGMVTDIVSSSWDSIMAANSQPIRMQRVTPTVSVTRRQLPISPKARVSFALQAGERIERSPTAQPACRAVPTASGGRSSRGA
jgi:pSer/pThr/pTyr-binding forkhead associated (FHA) protein